MIAHSVQHAAGNADRTARGDVEAVASWIITAARIGEAAFGLVFAIIGLFSARAAFGRGGGTTDPKGALAAIRDAPLGLEILLVIAAGLLGFALWSVLGALLDADGAGDSGKGVLQRFGHALRGLGYGVLDATALQQAKRPSVGRSSGVRVDGPRARPFLGPTARGAGPFGHVLLGIAGLGFVAFGLYECASAWFRRMPMTGRESTP